MEILHLFLKISRGISSMPFTAHDLRYEPDRSFPALYAYLRQRAQRFLRGLQYDSDEVDLVVSHVVERLVCLGIIGGGTHAPETALDRLSEAQFYAFLNHSIRNKAIDRLRKRRLAVATFSELEGTDDQESEGNPLLDVVEPVWGAPPFATPEEAALQAASLQELRNLLRHCILALASAPRQLRAVMQELEEMGAAELLQDLLSELQASLPPLEELLAHSSQHRDHAHKKLRSCLQSQSTNLAVVVALRLTEYKSSGADHTIPLEALARDGLTLEEVRRGLKQLALEGLLHWDEQAEAVHLDAAQLRRLARYYKTD